MPLKFKIDYKYIVSSAFLSLVLILFFITGNFELDNFKQRSISYATANGYDVAARVGFYYKLILVFLFGVLNFTVLFSFLDKFI